MIGIILKTEGLLILAFAIYLIIFMFKLTIKRKSLASNFFKKELMTFILVMYFAFVFGVTLCPLRISSVLYPIDPVINLNPFSILDYRLDYYSIINIVGNIILLAPLPTIMILNGFEKFKKVSIVLIVAISISITIEILQLLQAYAGLVYSPRATDILDLILNTLGAIVGVLVFNIYQKFSNPIHMQLK